MLGKKLTPEQCKKVSDAQSGRKRKPFSDEWLKNMGLKKKGDKNPMYGKTHSKETREKIRKKAQQRINIPESNEKRAEANRRNAIKRYQRIIPEIQQIQQSGITSFRGIARELNNRGFKTARGANWDDGGVKRILKVID